jgi:hypothetical protein
MFAPYTPLEQCVGKELKVRVGAAEYVGLLAGIYTTAGIPMLVITPLSGGGLEQHIPLSSGVVMVKP